jgi:phage-related protein
VEIVADHDGNAYRAVYKVNFAGAIYVLHAFQKKSRKGIKTPQDDIEMIKRRLRVAEQDYRTRHEGAS